MATLRPDSEIPRTLVFDSDIVHSRDTYIGIRGLHVFMKGIELDLLVRVSDHGLHSSESLFDRVMGSQAPQALAGLKLVLIPNKQVEAVDLSGGDGNLAASGVSVTGANGSELAVDVSYWISPLPFIDWRLRVEWLERKVDGLSDVISAVTVSEATSNVLKLWDPKVTG